MPSVLRTPLDNFQFLTYTILASVDFIGTRIIDLIPNQIRGFQIMPKRSDCIQRFLNQSTHADLASMYGPHMEVQVNVASDGGERVEQDFKGRRWHGWTDGMTTWKSFRMPYKAATEPEQNDFEIKFDLAEHAEGIGLTGWDWQNKVSKWVAFDFDAILGHSEKSLSQEELSRVREEASSIPWVTIRKSTSGQGLHIYVTLEDVSTKNHSEHSALARSILGKMSALTGFDFKSKVDICGGNMWIWHRKMKETSGLELLKTGDTLKEIPPNWRDHVKVVTGNRRKNLPQDIHVSFQEIANQHHKIPLDEIHRKVINHLRDINAFWWWDQDHHMLVTHTQWLTRVYEDLEIRGFYETNSKGANLHEQNCFAFPMRKGGWNLRRYTPGVQEHDSWTQDHAGWTRCYFNREPDFATACRTFGGVEDEHGGFVFREAEVAMKATELLGIRFDVANPLRGRETILKQHKDGRLVVTVDRQPNDPPAEMQGWLAKGTKPWTRIFHTQIQEHEVETGNFDEVIRHLVTESNEDYGWMLKSNEIWQTEPLTHVRVALQSLGHKQQEINNVLGTSIFKCWKVVNKPFQAEYPGDREWNRNAARFRFTPTADGGELRFNSWTKILEHCGKSLDSPVTMSPWAKANGIKTGADYVKCWIASLFQEPTEPLPYLFFYGPQNSGKSIFHEALSLLLTKGYKRADAALISQSGFNAELEGAIICVVEETELNHDKQAYNRIKDWVTSRDLLIHAKGRTPYHIPNTTHWIQCNNDHNACPIFSGDTRITILHVPSLDPLDLIPKKQFIPLLEKEAGDFLAEITNLELPPSPDRLNIPVIVSEQKILLEQLSENELSIFLKEVCQIQDGRMIKFSDFHTRFIDWLEPGEARKWSKIRVGREIGVLGVLKARCRRTAQFYLGNLCWRDELISDDTEQGTKKLVSVNGFLE